MMIVLGMTTLVIGLIINIFKPLGMFSEYRMLNDEEKKRVDTKGLIRSTTFSLYAMSAISFASYFLRDIVLYTEIIVIGSVVVITGVMAVKSKKYYNYENEKKSDSIIQYVVLGIAGIAVVAAIGFTLKPTSVEVTPSSIEVENINIEYSQIEKVEMIENVPSARKQFGGALGEQLKGSFSVEGFGDCSVYTENRDMQSIVIKTQDETVIFNLKNEAETKEIYDEIMNKMNNLKTS